MKRHVKRFGFTLVELMVVVSVIGILASIVYANFGSARAASRDDVRKASLEEVRLALELYKAQYGRYPAGCKGDNAWAGTNHATYGCGANYIPGLVSDFIAALPWDSRTGANAGYLYRTNSTGSTYKFMAWNTVEQKTVTSFENQYARCPATAAACPGATPPATTYAVYAAGAGAF